MIAFFLILLPHSLILSQTTTVQGIVRDSLTNKPIDFAIVSFENSTIGQLTDDDGKFSLSNNIRNNVIVVSLMGYESRRITVPLGKQTRLDIKLKGEGVQLKEVTIKPTKEKYSKKNNPAVELIKKVIAHKYDYLVENQSYYMSDEYDRLLFALNDYKSGKGLLKGLKYLSQYTSTSKIDDKAILPYSVRETTSNIYYRKDPKAKKRVITGYKTEGIDQDINTESIDGIIKEMFKDITITDNTINLLLSDFVGPLSSSSSVDFYKWYIVDTISIDQQKFINLGFVPFNTRDAGFIGNLLVKADSTYAIKKVSFRVSSKINVNYLDEMLFIQEFKELSPTLWIPERTTMAMDLSVYGFGKMYVEKVRDFSNFVFNMPVDVAFHSEAPEIHLQDYKKRDSAYWAKIRPLVKVDDLNMDEMVKQMRQNKLINVSFKIADILSSGYIATNTNEEKNKVDLGTPLTFFSYNSIEGARFRLTAATTKNFHPHLFLYGYTAYGTKDHKLKYYGETTWAFNNKEYHKDEFPRRNLSIAYKYDLNSLGQKYLQAERDNILMSLRGRSYDNMTYNRMAEIYYIHEFYNGVSFSLSGRSFNEVPAGNLKFRVKDENDFIDEIKDLKTTEVGASFRWATDDRFFQKKRIRRSLPSSGYVFGLSHIVGLKDVFGGQFNYNKSSLSIDKEFWIAPYGRLGFSLKGEKLWGTAPFTLLLSGNANTSITIQRGSFYTLNPLEFINDSQFTWDISYYSGGWLFNRIPLLNHLRLKEVFGFRGFWGTLSNRNNPEYNHNLLMFPNGVSKMSNEPFMEYSVGIQNIFQFFRIDYIHRLTYLDRPNIDKNAIRISFDMNF